MKRKIAVVVGLLVMGLNPILAVPVGNDVELIPVPRNLGVNISSPVSQKLTVNGAVAMTSFTSVPTVIASQPTIYVQNNQLFYKSPLHTTAFRIDVADSANGNITNPNITNPTIINPTLGGTVTFQNNTNVLPFTVNGNVNAEMFNGGIFKGDGSLLTGVVPSALKAPDGSPNPALWIDNTGNTVITSDASTPDDPGDIIFTTFNNTSQKARIFSDPVAGVNQLHFLAGGDTTPDVSIKEDGNVGIGTTAPAAKLHVVGSTFSTGTISTVFGSFLTTGGNIATLTGNISTEVGTISAAGATITLGKDLALKADILTANDPGDIVFLTNGGVQKARVFTDANAGINQLYLTAGTNTTPDVVVKEDGNVGIGTGTTATEKLQVAGNAKAFNFIGNGAGLKNIPLSSINTIGTQLQPVTVNGAITADFFNGGIFKGDGSQLTNLTATNINGVIPANKLDPNFRPNALQAPDGSPNPALNIDNNGNALFSGFIKLGNFSNGILLGSDTASPIPSADGFRVRRNNNFFGTTGADAIVIEKTDANGPSPDGGIVFANTGNDGIAEVAIAIRGNNRVGIGINNPTQLLDVAGNAKAFNFIGNGTGLKNIPGNQIIGTVPGTSIDASFRPTALKAPDGSPDPALWIDNTGNTVITSDSTTPNDPGDIIFTTFNNTSQKARIFSDANAGVNQLYFLAGGDTTPDVTIKEDGNVGIGTGTTATEKLQVTGNAKAFNFIGNGTGLKNIPLSSLNTSTTLQKLEVNGAITASSFNGGVFRGSFIGDGSLITNLTATNINGVIPANKLDPNFRPNALQAPDGDPNPALRILNNGTAQFFSSIKVPNFSNGTIIGSNTTEIIPTNDDFRIRKNNNFFGSNGADALIIEKTDSNGLNPDGGIAFTNMGNDGIAETAMVIRGNNRVGIGVTNPSQLLEVAGNVKAVNFIGNGTNLKNIPAAAIDPSFKPSALKAPDGSPDPALWIDNFGNTVITSDSSTPNDPGDIIFTTFNNTSQKARIFTNPTPGVNHLYFLAGNDSTPDVSIKEDGNVGIGLGGATASQKLEVAGRTLTQGLTVNLGQDTLFQANPATPNDPGDLVFVTSTNVQKARIWMLPDTSNTLIVSAGTGLGADLTIIGTTGNVGIANADPKEKLHITGNARAFNFIGNGTNLKNIPLSALDTSTQLQKLSVSGGIVASAFNGGIFRGDGSLLTGIVPSALKAPDGNPNPALQVDNAGRVGIGTTTPTDSWLHVVGTAATRVTAQHTTESTWSEFATAGVTSTNEFVKKWGVGSTGDTRAANLGGPNKFFVFQYTDSNDQSINGYRMVIDQTGNMGVGVTSPTSKLDVAGRTTTQGATVSQGQDLLLQASTGAANDPGDLVFVTNSNTQKARIYTQPDSSSLLYLAAGSTSTPDMTIQANGNVGIGTTNPSAKLDVEGSLLSGTSYLTTQLLLASSPTVTVTWSTANRQILLLTSNVNTVSFAGLPSSVVGSVVLEIRQDGTGGRTIGQWAAPIRWPGGYCPPLSTTPLAIDVVSCVWDGTYYLCQLSKDFKPQGT